jgi:hypothetical protein
MDSVEIFNPVPVAADVTIYDLASARPLYFGHERSALSRERAREGAAVPDV